MTIRDSKLHLALLITIVSALALLALAGFIILSQRARRESLPATSPAAGAPSPRANAEPSPPTSRKAGAHPQSDSVKAQSRDVTTSQQISRLMKEIDGEPLRYDQPGEATEFYHLKRLPEGETEIPVERYFEARERMRQIPQYSTASRDEK
jgi:hypothetical protein